MLVRSIFSARRRILGFSAAAAFVCAIAFYILPILPWWKKNSNHTYITPDDIAFTEFSEQLSPSARNALCYTHNVPPYEPHTSQRKVYDLFMLNTELDWLEIRLHELASQVDYFVILEAPTTFTGLPKKMYYEENKARFHKFEDKIIHHILESPVDGYPGHVTNTTLLPGTPEYEAHAWVMERYQRNAMFTQVLPFLSGASTPHNDDVILVSDIDEIPRPTTVQLLRECHFGRMTTLRSRFYYYSFQWLHRGQEWAHPQATTYHGPDNTLLPASLRECDGSALNIPRKEEHTIWNSSWHCSSCFATLAEMLDKMKSFSHTNLNAKKFRNKERIVAHIAEKRVDGGHVPG
ncbi:hypothetical protein E8E11_000768 [Didymella keratinophila]|nr:hypothetical protein E8E11_000768 [Didymella keratinophila]